jgi:predicted transcriptional regulator
MLPVRHGEWTFLSNHGHVLVSLARDPEARMRDVAEAVGITERAVQQIVSDLVVQGYLHKEKVGRRNRYEVVRRAHFRHDLEAGLTLGDFLDLVVGRDHRPVDGAVSHAESLG